MFYCVASSTSQYFGSITTLALKIPGETTSLPLLELMKDQRIQNRIGDVYFLTSFGSFVASIVSAILILFSFEYLTSITSYLRTYVIFACSLIGFVLCISFSENKIIVSFLLFLFGWIVGKIGYDITTNESFLTFGNAYLYGGIPTLPIIMGMYAIPGLFKMFLYAKRLKRQQVKISLTQSKSFLILETWKTAIVSSFVGFVMGLIPYIGNGMSSYISYLLDKKMNSNNPISNAVASETANNSANLSVLIPLLFLGIAIIPSEYLLLEILPLGNKAFSFLTIQPYLFSMFVLLILSNIVSFYFSWNCVRPFLLIILCFNKLVPICILLAVIGCVGYIGYSYMQIEYYLLVFIAASCVGLLFKSYDLLPFAYAFMLQNNFEQILYRMLALYI
jgi:putative tricarboxylic transport membrane protein